MDKRKARKWILISELLLAVILIYTPVIRTQFYHEITGDPKAANGAMDLSGCIPDKNIVLDGEWEFYWNQFIVSDFDETPHLDLMLRVPDVWSDYRLDGEKLPSGGYGSYRLIIDNLSYDKEVAIYIPEFGGAYRVYIDGQLGAQSGTTSQDLDKIFTTPSAKLYPLILSAEEHEVIIEVATTRFSGLYAVPILCDYSVIMKGNDARGALRLILFGVALFAFLILIIMYLFSIRRKVYSVWMPLLVFFILIRMMLTTQFYSLWQSLLFFNLSFESTNELMYFVTFGMKYLIIFMVQEQCGVALSRKIKIGFFNFYIILYLFYLVVPQHIYNDYFSVIIPALTFIMDIYLFAKIYQWRDRLNKYGMAAYLGEILLVIGLASNSYYLNGKIYRNMTMTLMVFFTLFLIIMVWVYTMRMSDLYDDFTVSTSRLEMVQKQVTIQKEYYEALGNQMSEIREIKHDINHFTLAMRQLAEEGNYDRLMSFLDEYCEKTKMDQLPIFCEHSICNSMIGYYYLRAKEYGIEIDCQCNMPGHVVMSDSDLCIVFGNALDNALFACKQMDLSQPRYIKIKAGVMKGQMLIKIVNSYPGQIKKKDGVYISLKDGNAHGYGIRNMSKVVETYGGFVKIEHTGQAFTFMAAVQERQYN